MLQSDAQPNKLSRDNPEKSSKQTTCLLQVGKRSRWTTLRVNCQNKTLPSLFLRGFSRHLTLTLTLHRITTRYAYNLSTLPRKVSHILEHNSIELVQCCGNYILFWSQFTKNILFAQHTIRNGTSATHDYLFISDRFLETSVARTT